MAKRMSEDEFVNDGLTAEEQAEVAAAPEQHEPEPGGEDELIPTDVAAQQGEEQPTQQPEQQPKMVDVRALQEARAESREIKEQYKRLEERTNAMLQMMAAQKAPAAPKGDEDPEPDPNVDIFAHNAWLKRQNEKLASKFSEREQAEQQARQVSSQEAQIWGHWEQSVAAVKTELPDFGDAAKWLSDARSKQLQAYAAVDPRFGDARAINQQIDSELRQIVIAAAQAGTNPAKAVYELAKSWGYAGPQQGNVPGRVPNVQPGPENIQRMAEQQERHRSLSDIAGGEPPKSLDAKALANMTDAQFKKLMANPAMAKQVDQIMGIE